MLVRLSKGNIPYLSRKLSEISEQDKIFFNPHDLSTFAMIDMLYEIGNHYYLFFDGDKCVGYGLLRTFGEYAIPSLGCIIWEKYRGQGLGRKLVSELTDKALDLGYPTVMLRVRKQRRKRD